MGLQRISIFLSYLGMGTRQDFSTLAEAKWLWNMQSLLLMGIGIPAVQVNRLRIRLRMKHFADSEDGKTEQDEGARDQGDGYGPLRLPVAEAVRH
jgi:hypothetical protein